MPPGAPACWRAGRGRADRGGHPPGCRGGALQRSAGGIYPSFWDQPIDPTALSDWGRMDSLRQEAVAELARRCVIQGKADGSFGYADPLQQLRRRGAVDAGTGAGGQ
ncbi:MAG: hypothetical protein ACLRNQ_16460 [Flavonifractor plautii]